MFVELEEFTKYERTRIIGARALQVAMGAPILVKTTGTEIDPIYIAKKEFDKGIVPLTAKRSYPRTMDNA